MRMIDLVRKIIKAESSGVVALPPSNCHIVEVDETRGIIWWEPNDPDAHLGATENG